ncbi:MAG TPA: DMT family transporter [Ktedonobacterales bacterium]|jgi:drug/metabolite transporter (DMT)-like permease
MGILLGLTAALCWGAADFLVRYATQAVGTFRTLLFMQLTGFVGLSLYMGAVGAFGPLAKSVGWQPWVWVAVSLLINLFCSLALYRSFEIGTLAVVSPISASYAALTVILAVLSGEALSQWRVLGIAAAMIGVVLAAVSLGAASAPKPEKASPHPESRLTRGTGYALVAAAGFGVLFWIFGFHVIPTFGGLVPVWLVRLSTPALLLVMAKPLRQSIPLPRGKVWWLLAGVGILDTIGYVAATTGLATHQVAVVTVLASLFSTVTVMLAWLFLRERLAWSQWVGVAAIFVGITLINI